MKISGALLLYLASSANLLAVTPSSEKVSAEIEELGEAEGLAPSSNHPDESGDSSKDGLRAPLSQQTVQPPADLQSQPQSPFRLRGYGLMDWRFRKRPSDTSAQKYGPNAELSSAVHYKANQKTAIFAEGRWGYDAETKKNKIFLEQGGLRVRPVDFLEFGLGKERNRRSPGLIISPSDFLHTQQNAPGLREERGGVWMSRISAQSEGYSVDLILLPYSSETVRGLPDADSAYQGSVIRLFSRLPAGIDLGVDVGRFDGVKKYGAFLQGIAASVYKLYGEFGRNDFNGRAGKTLQDASHFLLGGSYEGNSHYSFKLEYYQRDEAWTPSTPIFKDRKYATASVGLIELRDKFNITDTMIRCLETFSYANILRTEWLATDRQVLGLSALKMQPTKIFDWQLTADWKYSF